MRRAWLVALLFSCSAGAQEPKVHFVAVGHQGTRLSSSDGLIWKHLQTGKEGPVRAPLEAVAYGGR